MAFVKYNSIENHYNGKFVDFCKVKLAGEKHRWHVTEKVHGANLGFYSNGDIVKVAKRTSFIGEENFYNSSHVFEQYKENVRQLALDLGVPVVVYGELYGGFYNGESGAVGNRIQREVQYCPHNDFIAFDILNLETKTFLNFSDVLMYSEKHGIPTVPVMGTTTSLDQALAWHNEFGTFVPHMHGLAPIANNIAEGLVIRPDTDLRLANGSRVIFKSKADKFKEVAKESLGKKIASLHSDVTAAVIAAIRPNLTRNRMDSVVSKYGDTVPFEVLLRALVEDAVSEGVQENYDALTKDEQKYVRKAINVEACKLVKEVWNGSKALQGLAG